MTRILIPKKEVLRRTGLSYVSIWQRMREGTFPRPVRISDTGRPNVRWVESEVEAWIENRPRQTYMAPPEKRKRKRKRLAAGDR